MSGIICFLRYLLMKITCAMRDAISTTRVMSQAGLRGRLGDIDGVRIGRLVQARGTAMGWSQLTLAHNALVGLHDILYLIFKFAVTLRKSFAALTPWLGG